MTRQGQTQTKIKIKSPIIMDLKLYDGMMTGVAKMFLRGGGFMSQWVDRY
jgi:hypothetical protein